MAIDSLHITLTSIVVFLILLLAFIFGKNQSVGKIKSKIVSTRRKRNQQNQNYLEEMDRLLNKSVNKFFELILNETFSPFSECYSTFQKYCEDISQHEFLLDETIKVINWSKISVIRTNCENKISSVAQTFIEIQHQHMSQLTSFYPKAEIHKFLLSYEQEYNFSQRIKSIISQSFSEFFNELNNLQGMQSKCKALLPQVEEILNKKPFNLQDAAKSIGVSALIFAKPAVGLPALVSLIASTYQTNKKEQKNIEDLNTIYFQYINQWKVVFELYPSLQQRLEKELSPLMHYEYVGPVKESLIAVDKYGYSIKNFVDSFRVFVES